MPYPPIIRGLLAGALLFTGCGVEAPEPTRVPQSSAPAPGKAAPQITHFYVSPSAVAAGEPAALCYGVQDADTVSIEPEIREIRPSPNRCFTFSPRESGSNKYQLTATSPAGTATAELTLEVLPARKPPPRETPIITTFAASQGSVPKGMPVTLCYELDRAESVRIDPPVRDLEPGKHCFTVKLEETTTFQLTAIRGERTDEASVTVKIQ